MHCYVQIIYNNYQLNRVRNYHSYKSQNDGNEPPDWKLFVMDAL